MDESGEMVKVRSIQWLDLALQHLQYIFVPLIQAQEIGGYNYRQGRPKSENRGPEVALRYQVAA